MNIKKNAIIVATCLIPTISVLTFLAFDNDCINETEATSIFVKAADLEKNGYFEESYLKYKTIDAHACANYQLRNEAFNKAVAVKLALKK